MALPGLGQLYAGYTKEALNSFLLNSLLYALMADVIRKQSFIDGVLAIYPWLQRYYGGGYENAKKLTEGKINSQRNAVYQSILDLAEKK